MLPNVNNNLDDSDMNAINATIDAVRTMGKSIQDLVADGQLTPAQYAALIQSVNGLISKGNVTVADIDKNKGKIDQTYLTEQLLQQIAGTTPINAVPADESVDHTKLSVDALTMNTGKDFPLKSVKLGSDNPVAISAPTRFSILDAKVSGAKIGKYYRVTFIANGIVSNGRARWGITAEERNISDGSLVRLLFVYNNDDMAGNEQNATLGKVSDKIDTIRVDNGEIGISLTIDRERISNSSSPTFLNLAAGIGLSRTAVIDPVNYFF